MPLALFTERPGAAAQTVTTNSPTFLMLFLKTTVLNTVLATKESNAPWSNG